MLRDGCTGTEGGVRNWKDEEETSDHKDFFVIAEHSFLQ